MTHLRYPDNYEKTLKSNTEKKIIEKKLEKKKIDSSLTIELKKNYLQYSTNILLKNLQKYKVMVLFILSGIITHYFIISGIKII